VLVDRPLQVLAVSGVIVVGKTLAAVALVLALRYPLSTALTVGASLAQIGEFSFILAALGGQIGVLPPEAKSLIVAGALISIALNPLLFTLVEPVRRWIVQRSAVARRLEARDDPLAELPSATDRKFLARQVVLVGHGRVGQRVEAELHERGVPCVIVDQNRERIEALRAQGVPAVAGNAATAEVLVQAHIAEAGLLVVATSESTEVRAMIEIARTLNPGIGVVVRAPNAEEAALLRSAGANDAIHAHEAIAEVLCRRVLVAIPVAP
jgi:CPA2 family monovalent cation:H+ antiporter-2